MDANGHYEIAFDLQSPLNNCVSWNNSFPASIQGLPNALTGSADRHGVSDDYNFTGTLTHDDARLNTTFRIGANPPYTYLDNLFYNGNNRQVFTPGGNNKLGVGTNPSSATMMNLVGYNQTSNDPKDLRRIYLNGVSVELVAQHTDGSIEVNVRFDDVDVVNDARWCADEIQLNPVATVPGYSLNVTAGKTITLDRGTTATRRNNPETYNGQQVFTSPTLMRCPATTWLNLAPGGGFTVDNGSTLRLEPGSRMDVGNGAVLRVKRGGKLELMGGSVLNILPGGQVIIEEDVVNGNDGHLLFFPNARINMEASTSVLEIAGMLDIQANATFTTSRSGDPNTTYGLLKFTNTDQPSYNVTAGTNTRFILKSTNSNNRILHVEQESLYGPPSLLEFSLRKGKATLADNARIVPPVSNTCSINFVNAVVTSVSGVRNTHRGLRLNGQANAVLNTSTFSKGKYGAYCYNTALGNGPAPLNCAFVDCDLGMFNYDRRIVAQGCKFNDCNDGLVCQQMSQTSWLTDCTAQNNSGTGVSFQGSATLNVKNPAFDLNAVGLAVSGATAVVNCGSVSENGKRGFLVKDGGTLRMDDIGSGHDPVTAIKNGTSIWCELANNVYVDLGYNSLKPEIPGAQQSLYGTFLCQPYSVTQPARKNNWNGTVGTPLTTAEYSITTCGAPLTFVDPASSSPVPCGTAEGLLQDPGGPVLAGPEAQSLFAACPDCGTVTDAAGVSTPLNGASAAALALSLNDSLPDNELLAMEAFHAILSSPMPAPNDAEKFLLGYDFNLMAGSYGDALGNGQLTTAPDNAVLDSYWGLMAAVEDARIGAAAEGQDDFVFYTSLERAQLTRAAGKYDDAITQLQAIAQPPDTGEQALLATLLCWTQTERSVLNGTYAWNEVEAAMLQCTGQGGPKMMLQPISEGPEALPKAQPTLQPNPAASEVLVQGFAGEDCLLHLMDLTGRTVVREVRF
ncbi:MAG: right-handed parallel beta-helix repeat-containing protein, partial [Flavobacteriales bacterium]|nr:right-handed parallel beta-helix repeat-containing protein [Flavobacteriales bacterium]